MGKLQLQIVSKSVLRMLISPEYSTGNPRNKVALRPGFSLMDWIKLTKSGKDLAGTGGRMIPVTPSELRKHNKRSDAWMALNGKVNLPDLNLTDFIICG